LVPELGLAIDFSGIVTFLLVFQSK